MSRLGTGLALDQLRRRGGASPPPPPPPWHAGLLAYYRFDAGSPLDDAVGAADWSAVGTVGSVAGKVSGAVQTGGAGYLEQASAGAFDFGPADAFTLALWLYPTGSGVFGMAASKNGRYELRAFNDTTWQWCDPTGAGPTVSLSIGSVTLDAWQLLVVSHDPAANAGAGEFRIDLDNGAETNTGIGHPGGTGSNPLQLGARGGSNNFAGRADELAVAGRVWDAADIAAFWNGGAGTTL